MNIETLSQAANEARGLAIDAVHACSSGHLGLPLGSAEIGAALFGQSLSYEPTTPKWLNRDRFVLSAGHGSMFLYSWLHLAGYDLSLDEVKNFRVLHSKTPGHPEFNETPGVEATTGPLGQGIGNAVGYAVSAKMAAAHYNTAEHTIFDQHIVVLAGDGCLQEGVAAEAIAFAGHYQLDNLILIFDSNDVTLDAMAIKTQSEDFEKRFTSQGWDAQTIDGHGIELIAKTVQGCKDNNNGKPKVIIAKTEIARGIPEVAGTAAGHGEGGAKFADEARKNLGLPEEHFHVSEETRSYFAEHSQELKQKYSGWEATFSEWSSANPKLAEQLESAVARAVPSDLISRIPEFEAEAKMATRAAGGEVIQSIAKEVPSLISGSADLYGSTKNYIKSSPDWNSESFDGRNIWFGIREHGMGAILNGIAYDGIFRASGATFAVFADYLRPSIRLAGLAGLPVVYIFTHDSVGVGEDGPTHQPVETCSGLRVIPGVDVIRPADPEETAGAYASALLRTDGPTVLLLTRQGVPMQSGLSAKERREGTHRGGYILQKESAELETILIASGSEVQHAIEAAKELGAGTRVVSMPCMEKFDRQSDQYREEILPSSCSKRIAIEAGVSGLWYKYVGTGTSGGKVIGIDRFGMSAPGDIIMDQLGMKPESLIEAARA